MTDVELTELEDRLAAMPEADVRREYLATDGAPGNPIADLLAGELERRNIDV